MKKYLALRKSTKTRAYLEAQLSKNQTEFQTLCSQLGKVSAELAEKTHILDS